MGIAQLSSGIFGRLRSSETSSDGYKIGTKFASVLATDGHAMRLLACCVAVFAIIGSPSATGSERRPAASLAHAHHLVRAALRLENAAMHFLERHDGVDAASKIQSAEGSLQRAVAAVKRAPLDAVDQ